MPPISQKKCFVFFVAGRCAKFGLSASEPPLTSVKMLQLGGQSATHLPRRCGFESSRHPFLILIQFQKLRETTRSTRPLYEVNTFPFCQSLCTLGLLMWELMYKVFFTSYYTHGARACFLCAALQLKVISSQKRISLFPQLNSRTMIYPGKKIMQPCNHKI